ncbi:hypothetical protein HYH03_015730 [Edaphochlamys debaryana]|uniref:Protein kinase domain-containing protein n=1 Tax=Edaphochlamys debaryana TaxID=47281 RepID=A0A835XLD8_9CHLO|nr:hypothetical protein HYH03_015730 [Edaphochlamys debaryana]|eukprot:KAG2485565.1 hypothetical protein HYH03_015730 [Edaphochlamys debaryana]
MDFRGARDPMFTPGIDLIKAAEPAEAAFETAPATLVFQNCALVFTACLPPFVVEDYLRNEELPPSPRWPAEQLFTTSAPQPGCGSPPLPSPAAGQGSGGGALTSGAQPTALRIEPLPPLLQGRCWPEVLYARDLGFPAMDPNDDVGSNVSDGARRSAWYYLAFRNMTVMCRQVVDEDCLMRLGPFGCIALALNQGTVHLPPVEVGLQPSPAPAEPPPPPAVGAQAPATSGGDDDVPVGAIVGGVVGGTIGLVLVIAVTALLYRRSRHRRGKSAAATAGASSGETEKGCRALALATATDVEAQASGKLFTVLTCGTPFRADVECSGDLQLDDPSPSGTPKGPKSSISAAGPSQPSSSADDNVVRLLPEVLGKGAFGRVRKGVYRGRYVAVKQLLGEHDLDCASTAKALETTFNQELEVLARCEHPCIVRLLAACAKPPTPFVVLEMLETSLDKVLYGSGARRLLPVPLVLHIGLEVARGLEYLHPTVTHRDLKPANVLINDPWGPKPVVKLTECFDVTNSLISHKADMFAFGVLLWEMLSGTQPWRGLGIVEVAYQITMMGRRLPLPPAVLDAPPDRWPRKVVQLIQQCWDSDPARRPAAAEAVKWLALEQQREEMESQSNSQVQSQVQSRAVLREGEELAAQPRQRGQAEGLVTEAPAAAAAAAPSQGPGAEPSAAPTHAEDLSISAELQPSASSRKA